MKGGPSWWRLAWRGFPPVGTCKHPGVPAVPPQPGGHPCSAGRGFVPAGWQHWGKAWVRAGDVPSGGHQRLELPLVLLTVEVQAVHDLVLLFWWDEVLDDQVPERVTDQERDGAGARGWEGAGEEGVNVASDRKQVGKGEEKDVRKRVRQRETGKRPEDGNMMEMERLKQQIRPTERQEREGRGRRSSERSEDSRAALQASRQAGTPVSSPDPSAPPAARPENKGKLSDAKWTPKGIFFSTFFGAN